MIVGRAGAIRNRSSARELPTFYRGRLAKVFGPIRKREPGTAQSFVDDLGKPASWASWNRKTQ